MAAYTVPSVPVSASPLNTPTQLNTLDQLNQLNTLTRLYTLNLPAVAVSPPQLIPIVFRLVGTVDRDADVVGLFLRQRGELGTELLQMQAGDLFVQFLW